MNSKTKLRLFLYSHRRNFRTRFNFVLFTLSAESTKCSSIRKPCKYNRVCDSALAVRKFTAYKSSRTLEYEIFTRTKISAITVSFFFCSNFLPFTAVSCLVSSQLPEFHPTLKVPLQGNNLQPDLHPSQHCSSKGPWSDDRLEDETRTRRPSRSRQSLYKILEVFFPVFQKEGPEQIRHICGTKPLLSPPACCGTLARNAFDTPWTVNGPHSVNGYLFGATRAYTPSLLQGNSRFLLQSSCQCLARVYVQFARSTCLGNVLTTAVCSDKKCSKSSLQYLSEAGPCGVQQKCHAWRKKCFFFQTSDFRDIYLNRIAEKVNQYLSGCVPVDEKYGT